MLVALMFAVPTVARAGERDRQIQAAVARANLEERTKTCSQMFDDAMSTKAQRHYEQAVDKLQRIVDHDLSNDTGFAEQAQQQVAAIKSLLLQQAAPFRAEGRDAFLRRDYPAARQAYRRAITIDPYDQTLVLELQPIQLECDEQIRRELEIERKRMWRLDIRRLDDGSEYCPWP